MNMTRKLIGGVMAVGMSVGLCAIAIAQPESGGGLPPKGGGGPSGGGPDGGGPGTENPRGWNERGRPGGDWWRDIDVQKHWDAAYAYATAAMPYRTQTLKRIDPKDPEMDNIRRFIVMRYLMMERIKQDDPKFWDIRSQQMLAEDQLFQLLAEPASDEADKNRQIELKVRELVKLDLRERQHRLDKLQAMVGQERDRLQVDQGREDEMVAERVKDLEKKGVEGMRPRMGRPGQDRWRDPGRDRPAPDGPPSPAMIPPADPK